MKQPGKIKKLIVVSNREPYSMQRGKLEKTIGGLVSALDDAMRKIGGVWIAASAKTSPGKCVEYMVPPDKRLYKEKLIPVGLAEYDNYYNGYSNRVLWPVCHITLDRVYFRKKYWEAYHRVNAAFAEAIVREADKMGRKDAIVWLQDYHLSVCAGIVKKQRPLLRLAIFWHIPWPSYDVFRVAPYRKEVLEGMLANDLIGFQLDSFRVNFARCAQQELGADVSFNAERVIYNGKVTRLRTFPVSVNFEWFDTAARDKQGQRFLQLFLRYKALKGKKLGISVDRIEYTKGFLKSFEALDIFFSKYPRYRGKLTYIQVAVPTRKVEPYLSYRDSVVRAVKGLNAKYSHGKWRPVEFIERKLTHRQLAALYRAADFAKIGSVYDGMNLVAKEYVAAQTDLTGTVLISEFAGASDDIPGAVIINPYDVEGCADAMYEALESGVEQRRVSMERARDYVRRNNVHVWVEQILGEISAIG